MPLDETKVTIERIMSYSSFSKEGLIQELQDLDECIGEESLNPLLYSARARVKNELGIEHTDDILKRFQLDPQFTAMALSEISAIKGTPVAQEEVTLENNMRLTEIRQQQVEKIQAMATGDNEESVHDRLKNLVLLLNNNEFTSAKTVADDLCLRYPNNPVVLLNVGSVYVKLNDLHRALELFSQAHELSTTEDPRFIIQVIGVLYQMKHYKEALKNVEIGLKQFSDNVTLVEFQAQCYVQLGEEGTARHIIAELQSKVSGFKITNQFLRQSLSSPEVAKQENQLRVAAYKGDIQSVKILLEEGISVNCYGNKTRRTPLMWLCRGVGDLQQRIKIANLFKERNVTYTVDVDGNSYLHHLVYSKNYELFYELLSDITPEHFTRQNNKGETPYTMLLELAANMQEQLNKTRLRGVVSQEEIEMLNMNLPTIRKLITAYDNMHDSVQSHKHMKQ